MYYHARWLVYNQQILVFIDDVKGDIFGVNFCISWRMREHNRDLISGFNLVAGLDCFGINQHVTRVYGVLNAVS